MEVKGSRFSIIVHPGSKESCVAGFDERKQAYIVKVKSKPQDNKANIEVIKLLSKALKAKVVIAHGLKSRNKVIEIFNANQ